MKAGDIVASKYRLIARIGQGGMGSVWKASNTFTGREFAIKFLLAQVASHEDSRHRFTQEARASARINHPNAIDVYDVGESEDGGLYLVMELLDGLSLAEALRAQPGFSARELLILLAEASTALNAAHNSGVIHRDLKPGNIFLHKDRASGYVTAKVLDFGVSKLLGADEGVATHTGSLLGSPRYMAPEQAISASQADARSDIWSLGIVLFEALTGRFPHDGENSNNLIIAIATTPPKSINDVAPQLPASLRQLVDDCLRPPAQRIPSIRVFLDRTLAILATEDLTQIALARPSVARGKAIGRPDGLMFRTTAGAIPGLATSMLHQQGLDVLAQHLSPPAGPSSQSYAGPMPGTVAPPLVSRADGPSFAPPSSRSSFSAHPSYSSMPAPQTPVPSSATQPMSNAPQPMQQQAVPLAAIPLNKQTMRIPVMHATPAFHAAAAAASDPTVESVSSINVVRPDRFASSPPIARAQPQPRKVLFALVGVLGVGAVVSIALLVITAGGDRSPANAAAPSQSTPARADATPDKGDTLIEPKPSATVAPQPSATTASSVAATTTPSASPSAAPSSSSVAVTPTVQSIGKAPNAIPSAKPRPSSTKVTGMDTGLD